MKVCVNANVLVADSVLKIRIDLALHHQCACVFVSVCVRVCFIHVNVFIPQKWECNDFTRFCQSVEGRGGGGGGEGLSLVPGPIWVGGGEEGSIWYQFPSAG